LKAVVQRVSDAQVIVNEEVIGKIGQGFLVLLGIGYEDSQEDIDYLISKIAQMRIFNDYDHKMNLSLNDIHGNCLVVSQFTLYADTRKGNRPSFVKAAKLETARAMYQLFLDQLSKSIGQQVECGIFGADMKVSLTNDGPVTIILDSKER
jgi:D-tyrosyl-tRNA(Tyr) deacylase